MLLVLVHQRHPSGGAVRPLHGISSRYFCYCLDNCGKVSRSIVLCTRNRSRTDVLRDVCRDRLGIGLCLGVHDVFLDVDVTGFCLRLCDCDLRRFLERNVIHACYVLILRG